MFERFTEQARLVVVRAQESARELNHGYVGKEHLLLALLVDGEEVPAQVLGSLGVDGENARAAVIELVGVGTEPQPGNIPFTPEAKKVIEVSLRESLALGHSDIRPGHLLLGLLRDQDGVAIDVLSELNAQPEDIRERVLARLPPGPPRAARLTGVARGLSRVVAVEPEPGVKGPLCASCERPLTETLRVKTVDAVRDGEGSSVRVDVTFCGGCGAILSSVPPPRSAPSRGDPTGGPLAS
jgi:ATP-dependent Clp protease ATP-binding subunit ClpA